jgi:4-hydroxyphenylacetate 3-monooxygenase
MTRSGDDYVRGLHDGRTVLLNGERVSDVTTHPAFAAGIRTVAQLYDLARDPANAEVMTYPSPRDGGPINRAWLVPRTRDDLAMRRRAIKFWADASYGFLGRSPDHARHFLPASRERRGSTRGAGNSLPTIFYVLQRRQPTRTYI